MVWKKFNINMVFVLLSLVIFLFLLSGCDEVTGNVIKNSQPIVLKCTGETTAVLQDYCVAYNESVVKLLIKNGFITELRHVIVNLDGTKGSDEQKLSLRIEIDEQKIVKKKIPKSIGDIKQMIVQVYYFGNSGMEKCIKEKIPIENIRECGQSAQR